MQLSTLLACVPVLPFLGFLLLVLAGSRFSRPVIAWIGVGSVGISALLAAAIGFKFLIGTLEPYRLVLGSWMEIDAMSVPIGFYLDALTMTMLFVVTGVGFLIHVYAAGFMHSDSGYARFFAYMNLFVAAMLVLVLADNLVLLYLGWEGVGLCSYLLIGFWYEHPDNGYAARKAFVMTRVGDTAMALGLFLLFSQLHSFDIQALMQRATMQWPPGSMLPVAAATLLLGGALGKSAQLPLQTWLPDAMAGPTPVSALIHAATMVTAGVYLIARTHELFILAPVVQSAVALLGTCTLLIAGCSALAQTDIKRILAYSTISQIGYMFLALGVGAWSAAIFHLLTHAFFKALLFLAAGAVIFCFHQEHNIFKMGGLRKAMPLTFWSFIIGSAALSGLPFTSGFYSKHQILQAAFEVSPVLWAAGCLGALITGMYSFRLVFVVFFGGQARTLARKSGLRMNTALLLLSILALFGGMLQVPLDSVFPLLSNPVAVDTIDLVAVITIAAPVLGLLIAVPLYLTDSNYAQRFASYRWVKPVQQFFYSGWGFDTLYDYLLVQPFKVISKLNKNDAVDGLFLGIAWLSVSFHRLASATQTGRVRWYAGSLAIGVAVILAIGLAP